MSPSFSHHALFFVPSFLSFSFPLSTVLACGVQLAMESLVFSQVQDQAEDQACSFWCPEMAANPTAMPPGIPLDNPEIHAEFSGTWEPYGNGPNNHPYICPSDAGESASPFAESASTATCNTAAHSPNNLRDFMSKTKPL